MNVRYPPSRLASWAAAIALAATLIAALLAPPRARSAPLPRHSTLLSVATTRPASQPARPGLAAYVIKPAYEKAISQFETSATTRPVKIGGTVFIGSSSFTRWKTLEKDMAAFDAVNRGFGGSRSDDILYYASRILTPLRPTRIVYYCGGNDLASKRSAEIVIENFKLFVTVVRHELPAAQIYFVAQNVTPKRAVYAEGDREINQAIAAWAMKVPGVHYLDAQTGLLDAGGNPRPDLFVKDGIHLNDDGYRIWKANIERELGRGT
jgi:lysophospholipase L1-like esterase